MIERIKRARRLAHPMPVIQRGARRRAPCPAEEKIGPVREAIETGRKRLTIMAAILLLAFSVVGLRLVDITLMQEAMEPRVARAPNTETPQFTRANIVDRNGALLATSLPTASLYADPRQVIDAKKVAERLAEALPGLDSEKLAARLASKRGFVWIKRHLTPRQQKNVIGLGLPGVDFRREERRVYPQVRLLSHVVGYVDIDEKGIAGIERHFEDELRRRTEPLELSIDMRIQHALCGELAAAQNEFDAVGAAGLVLDVRTAEVMAMCSLPDFDPNTPMATSRVSRFNRAALGVYELGSAFKIFTTAMALDGGIARLEDRYDATKPLKISRFTIRDYHAKKRWLSVEEIFMYSSNIGSARLASEVGGKTQRSFLDSIGLLKPSAIELPEVGTPILPHVWRPINTMTIGFGHGIAVSPLQLAAGVSAMVNGGVYRQPTMLKRYKAAPGRRVISERTSNTLRKLLRLVVEEGTGSRADTSGYRVGGKTGTAEKSGAEGYIKRALLSSFIGVFPVDEPRFVIFALLDEPKGTKKTNGYATGGWVAAPIVGRVVRRIGPVVGIRPYPEKLPSNRRNLVMNRAHGAATLASY
ncbi:MAG: penicillin-binding protein 2 [Pseudomonadota bacterium]|nr:penicillin-binding protein 2 [Pseudomonadota bacterium]